MKFRTLLIAASLLAGAGAFAAPNDTAKSPATTTAGDVVRHPVKHVKMTARHVKHVIKRDAHKANVAMHRHHRSHMESTASVPQTSVTSESRESRMNQALANFRRG
ncbi:MAG: hypothetical protein ABI907_10270 [Ramlibacter sp.]